MIVRYGGGNSGIGEYLVGGVKQGRDYVRDELDTRIVLDGDLDLTEEVIASIADNGQERYLHITLSFSETDISEEKMRVVTQEYKENLMSAYSEEEYCFYAEAHYPKVKYYTDNQTGELVERKPHVHIVIPKINLVSNTNLNPVGMVLNNVVYLDAIQEKINHENNLISPKDRARVGGYNKNDSLCLHKADMKGERQREFKERIISQMNSDKITSYNQLKEMLNRYGEVRTYNAGTDNEYLGVRTDGENKFTRLKNIVFTEKNPVFLGVKNHLKYVDNKSIYNDNISIVEEWKDMRSREIKYLETISNERRREYWSSDDKNWKLDKLDSIEDAFNQKRGISNVRKSDARIIRDQGRINAIERGGNTSEREDSLSRPIRNGEPKRSTQSNSRKAAPNFNEEERLPPLRSRHMVYGIQGRNGNGSKQSQPVLHALSVNNMAEIRKDRQYPNRDLRQAQENRRGGGRRISNGSVTSEMLQKSFSLDVNTQQLLNKIKQEIDPERFVSYCVHHFNVNPKEMKISKGRDGSPRFGYSFSNLNALDYMTKGIGVRLDEAIDRLNDVFQEQKHHEPFNRIKLYKRDFSPDEMTAKRESYKSKSDELWHLKKIGNRLAKEELRDDLRYNYRDKKLSDHEKEMMRGVYMLRYMREKNRINEVYRASLSEIRNDHFNFDIEKLDLYNRKFEAMKKEFDIDDGNVNAIIADDSEAKRDFKYLLDKNAHYAKHEMDMSKNRAVDDYYVVKGKRFFGMVESKVPTKLQFNDKETNKEIFVDKGEQLYYRNSDVKKDDVAFMAEYAYNKYGKDLKLKGSGEFKTAVAISLAEKGLDVQLRPKKYMEIYEKHKEILQSSEMLSGIRIKDDQAANIVLSKHDVHELSDYSKLKIDIHDDQLMKLPLGRNDVSNERLDRLNEIAEEYDYTIERDNNSGVFYAVTQENSKLNTAQMLDELSRSSYTYGVEIADNQEAEKVVSSPSVDQSMSALTQDSQDIQTFPIPEPFPNEMPVTSTISGKEEIMHLNSWDVDIEPPANVSYDPFSDEFQNDLEMPAMEFEDSSYDDYARFMQDQNDIGSKAINDNKEKENKEKEKEKTNSQQQAKQDDRPQTSEMAVVTLGGLLTAYKGLSFVKDDKDVRDVGINADMRNLNSKEQQSLINFAESRGFTADVFGGDVDFVGNNADMKQLNELLQEMKDKEVVVSEAGRVDDMDIDYDY